MSDEELRQRYQAGLKRRVGSDHGVSVEQLEALVAHRLSEAEAVALLDRVMADEGLRREYELLRSIEATRTPASSWIRPAVLALAAGIAAVVAIASLRSPREDVAAGTVRGTERGVLLVSPAPGAAVPLPETLVWSSVSGARGYRVEVLAPDGTVVLAHEGVDTTLTVLPGAVPLGTAQWWVEVRFASGADRSELRQVTFAAP